MLDGTSQAPLVSSWLMVDEAQVDLLGCKHSLDPGAESPPFISSAQEIVEMSTSGQVLLMDAGETSRAAVPLRGKFSLSQPLNSSYLTR